jgi:hypothetical protein
MTLRTAILTAAILTLPCSVIGQSPQPARSRPSPRRPF